MPTPTANALPAGWERVPLGSIVQSQYGSSMSTSGGGPVAMLGMRNIVDGRIDVSDVARTALDEADLTAYTLRPGDILFNRTNSYELVGKTAVYPTGLAEPHVFASYLVRLVVDEQRVHPNFLCYAMNTAEATTLFRSLATVGVSQCNINPTILKQRFTVALPPLPVQRRIVAVLDAWTRAEDAAARLIAAKTTMRTTLTRQLLTGVHRLGSGVEEWRATKFGEFLKESRTVGSHGGVAKKLSVRLYGRGIVEKKTAQAGSEQTRYYTRRAGQFVYSKLDFLNGAFAIVPTEFDGYETTLDMPAFDLAPTVHPGWLLNYVTRPEFYTRHVGIGVGGRKAKRINPADFLSLTVQLPPIEEQRRIAALLNAADRELMLLRSQLDAVRRQKRGLMQQLLTGQLTVPE